MTTSHDDASLLHEVGIMCRESMKMAGDAQQLRYTSIRAARAASKAAKQLHKKRNIQLHAKARAALQSVVQQEQSFHVSPAFHGLNELDAAFCDFGNGPELCHLDSFGTSGQLAFLVAVMASIGNTSGYYALVHETNGHQHAGPLRTTPRTLFCIRSSTQRVRVSVGMNSA